MNPRLELIRKAIVIYGNEMEGSANLDLLIAFIERQIQLIKEGR